jgi:hypothetical protein
MLFNDFVWYLPSPNIWIRCEIVSDLLGRVTARTYLGDTVTGLRKRRVLDATILE